MNQPACGAPDTLEEGRQVIYLFGFVRTGTVVDLQKIEMLAVGDVAAAFQRVSADEWNETAAEANLQDSEWVVPRVWQHGQVIEALNACSTVLPARFGAVFTSEGALEEFLRHRVGEIIQFFEQVSDHEEWSLKSFLNVDQAGAWLMAIDPEFAERHLALSEHPGKRYFQEKLLRAAVKKRAVHSGQSLAARVLEQLRPLSVEVRPLRLQPSADPTHEMVGHDAWLLPQLAVAEFRGRVERLQAEHFEQGLVLESSGPWPPYSFSPSFDESSP